MSSQNSNVVSSGDADSAASNLSFSPEREAEFQKLLTRYPNTLAMVMPTLHLAQEEFGYISVPVMEYVAERLDQPPAKVLSTATFYTMFNKRPVGRYHITVCTSPPCYLVGSDEVVKFFEGRLGIKVGQTTPDKMFTLGRAECLASCGTGPMLQCNEQYFENLNANGQLEANLDRLLAQWRAEAGPSRRPMAGGVSEGHGD